MPRKRPRPVAPPSPAPPVVPTVSALGKAAPDEAALVVPTRDQLPAGYATFLADVAARVRAAHLRTAVAVNRGLVTLYWEIGREIVRRQRAEGWGAEIVARLADDLRREFPGARGFTRRNLYYARAFYLGYPAPSAAPEPPSEADTPGARAAAMPIVQQPVARMGAAAPTGEADAGDVPPEPLALLPWGHNILLLEQLDAPALRLWYARQAVTHGWSRNVLGLQVQSRLHERQGPADQTTNFATTLPPAQSDLARAVVKDPYNFEFLTVAQDAHERHVEAGLVAHMRQFLLELGIGFLYAGNQYRLQVGEREFFLDLLFYHKRLRCWVVLDLKTGDFEPEHAGKMHFYLNAVDAQLRDAGDQPSIGLILCRGKDRVVAEWALRGMTSPMGVAEYRVTERTDALPAELRAALPSLEAVRAELEAAPLDDVEP